HDVEEKAQGEIVTEADKASEGIILGILRKEFPQYAILSEESGSSGNGGMMWVVDPLDGTTNYSIRNPFFNVSIGLASKAEQGWEMVSGVVYAPFTGEVFFAEKGEGSFLNGDHIQVSEEELSKALVTYCHGSTNEQVSRTVKMFSTLKPLCRDFSRMRAGALELAFVAAGRTGAHISPGGKPWDSAAGSLLVQEAGGIVTDFTGQAWSPEGMERDILATNKVVHEKILEKIKEI
ncbi:MAG: inositol monophosphatase, partial [Candidatus Aenigmarchaeota archaeon]|nr:inositol monophosphatase [Candidatus Aenigmarchaeota archaeon]